MKDFKILKLILLVVSVLLFIFACSLPVYYSDNGNEYSGFSALIVGWVQFFHNPVIFVAWFANIFYFISLICGFFRKLYVMNILIIVVGLFLSLLSFLPESFMTDEGGTISDVRTGFGVYVWIFAFFLMMIRGMLPFTTTEAVFKEKQKEISVDDFK